MIRRHAPLVHALFSGGGPSAVTRFVIAVYVNAVNRMLRGWARPHVLVEVLERLQPPIAHRDATTAIPREVFLRHSGATADHPGPRSILTALRESVRDRSGHQLLAAQAPTRMCAVQVVDLNHDDAAAFTAASASPPSCAFRIIEIFENFKSSMSTTWLGSWHGRIVPYFGLSLADWS